MAIQQLRDHFVRIVTFRLLTAVYRQSATQARVILHAPQRVGQRDGILGWHDQGCLAICITTRWPATSVPIKALRQAKLSRIVIP